MLLQGANKHIGACAGWAGGITLQPGSYENSACAAVMFLFYCALIKGSLTESEERLILNAFQQVAPTHIAGLIHRYPSALTGAREVSFIS